MRKDMLLVLCLLAGAPAGTADAAESGQELAQATDEELTVVVASPKYSDFVWAARRRRVAGEPAEAREPDKEPAEQIKKKRQGDRP